MISEYRLRHRFPNLKISANRSYKEVTSLGVGAAPLPLLAEPENQKELSSLLRFLSAKKIPFFILGAGTNLVGSDSPYDGVAIRLSGEGFTYLSIENDCLSCGAYQKLPMVAAIAAKAGLKGFSPLSGIPGSIGGALRMNAGASGVEIGSLVQGVIGVRRDGRPWKALADEIEWVYRGNSIPPDVIITGAVFRLTKGNSGEEEQAIAAEQENRKRREPAGRSAGCAFRNVSELEPAGLLIDRCGLRGFRIGDLIVSEKHANYLLNIGNATEHDYIRMIRVLRRAVSEKFGFYLRTEIVPVNSSVAEDIEVDTPSPRINVLYGGTSSEREISLQSGDTVAAALRKGGFKVELTDIRRCAVTSLMRECDVVYPVLHGGFGENGELQAKMEQSCLRFVGSGSAASERVMDKLATKRLLEEIQLPTAPWASVSREDPAFPEKLHFPVMIKAPREGSTVGIIKVNSMAEWADALEKEFRFADELLVEEFISGTEITVPILNATALDAVEIASPTGFYDWDAKYEYKNGQTEYFCPPKSLSPEVVARAQDYALKFYHAARCRDILRVDFIVAADGTPYILEGNNLPGNTAHSLVPKAARAAGISMEAMTARLVYAAMKRSEIPEGMEVICVPGKGFRFLLGSSRWLFRLTLVLCAALLIYGGICMMPYLHALPLLAGGALLLVSEMIFLWFRNLENK